MNECGTCSCTLCCDVLYLTVRGCEHAGTTVAHMHLSYYIVLSRGMSILEHAHAVLSVRNLLICKQHRWYVTGLVLLFEASATGVT
jgi:hypothetical protein